MQEKHIARLNAVLAKWQGANAFFNLYRENTSDQFILGLTHADGRTEPIGISFFNCEYLAGPTRWSAADLVAERAVCADGSPGFEVKDTRVGFVVRGSECVSIGDTGEVINAQE